MVLIDKTVFLYQVLISVEQERELVREIERVILLYTCSFTHSIKSSAFPPTPEKILENKSNLFSTFSTNIILPNGIVVFVFI